MFAQLTQRDTGSVPGFLGVKLHMTSASNFRCRGLGGVISIGIIDASWLAWLVIASATDFSIMICICIVHRGWARRVAQPRFSDVGQGSGCEWEEGEGCVG